MIKKYAYKDIDGNHWPDANAGDDMYYSINYAQWASTEGDTFVSVNWVLPDGVTSTDDFQEYGQVIIKLATPNPGVYKIICELVTEEDSKQQSNTIPMLIKVY